MLLNINEIIQIISLFSSIMTFGASCVTSIATAIYVIFAIKLVYETKLLREQTFSPEIIVFLDFRNNHLYLCVSNIGNGIARNVTFHKRNEKDLTDLLEGRGIYIFGAGVWNGLKEFAPEQKFTIDIGPSEIYKIATRKELPIIEVDYYDRRNNNHKNSSYTIDPYIYIDKVHNLWLVS